MKIAKVLTEYTNLKIDRPFDYFVPDFLNVIKGIRVNINFNNKNIVGYVEDVFESDLNKAEYEKLNGYELKGIDSVIDEKPLLNDELTSLAHFLSERTLSSLINCYRTILPPSLKPMKYKEKNRPKAKAIKIIDNNFQDVSLTSKDKELINILKGKEVLLRELHNYLSNINKLLKLGKLQKFDTELVHSYKIKEYKKVEYYELTSDQKNVINEFNASDDKFFLLEGVTGSGKTEIYVRLAKEALEKNKNVLILVSEISLTPLMIKYFKERFDYPIAILHSKLSFNEKYNQYKLIKDGKIRIVIGARSACLSPLENIGLIVIDEEHSDTYKQESHPEFDLVNYNMIDVIKFRSKYHDCKIILGSATPSIESKSYAIKGIYHQLYLDKRINNNLLPIVQIVDMRREVKAGNYSFFSRLLIEKIQQTIDLNKQVILLLNRRGYSTNLKCNHCGYVFKCENCGIPLHYHKNDNKLKCHYCGYSIKKPIECPSCKSPYIREMGIGTEKLEEEIRKLFPCAKIARLDLDSTSHKGSLEKTLSDFEQGKYNILLGTQIIAKGLDFNNVDLVGVINADTSLYFSDFRASEKAYQLLTQVVGRCGRGESRGLAIIQTYSPNNQTILNSAKQDYNTFYLNEIKYRKQMNYPPFCFLASFTLSSPNKDNLYKYCYLIKNELDKYKDDSMVILGPSEPFINKINNKYRYRFILKYKDKNNALKLLKYIKDLVETKSNIDVSFDTSPYQNL